MFSVFGARQRKQGEIGVFMGLFYGLFGNAVKAEKPCFKFLGKYFFRRGGTQITAENGKYLSFQKYHSVSLYNTVYAFRLDFARK